MGRRTTSLSALWAALLLALTGCSGLSIPTDPLGTLEEITGGTLQVGVADNGKWVKLPANGEPQGIEPDLVREFAARHNAEIEWNRGVEHELVLDLKHKELDMVIGGFGKSTPWTKHAAKTRSYVKSTNEHGQTVNHVMLTLMGENRFLLELDQFLLNQRVTP